MKKKKVKESKAIKEKIVVQIDQIFFSAALNLEVKYI